MNESTSPPMSIKRGLPLPSGRFDVAEVAVRHPELIECAGVDTRFQGALRTFPGFRRVGIPESYEGLSPYQDEVPNAYDVPGALIVGPGIDHVEAGLYIWWGGDGVGTVTVDHDAQTLTIEDPLGPVEFDLTNPDQDTMAELATKINSAPYVNWSAVATPSWCSAGSLASINLSSVGPVTVGEDSTPSPQPFFAAHWKHWRITRAGNAGRRFFKQVNLQKASGSSEIISGFVANFKYQGEVRPTASENVNGAAQYAPNPGLPKGQYAVVAYLYWDDETYTHPVDSTLSRGAGWRVRILSQPVTVSADTPYDVRAVGFGNMDVTAEGKYAYIVNPTLSQQVSDSEMLGSLWGSPDQAAADDAISNPDAGSGAQVIYWDDTYKYPIMRPMGQEIPEGEEPEFWYSGHPPYNEGVVSKNDFGKLSAPPAGELPVVVGITLRNSQTGGRSAMIQSEAFIGPDGNKWRIGTIVEFHTSNDERFDKIELWRSPPGATAVLYLENTVDMPTLADFAYDDTIDRAADRRGFLIAWGLRDVQEYKDYNASRPDERKILVVEGAESYAIMANEAFDGVWEFTSNPPDDTTRLATQDQVTFAVVDKTEWDASSTDLKPWVPPRLRWTSLTKPRPENFGDVYNTWTPDQKAGRVFGLVYVGDAVFVPGAQSLIVARRLGARVVVVNMGPDLAPVSPQAWAVGGNRFFTLSRQGLFSIDGITGNIQPLLQANRILLGAEHWGPELQRAEGYEWEPGIGLACDETGGVLFIWNANAAEAIVYDLLTKRWTRLYDFPWIKRTWGALYRRADNLYGSSPRAFFLPSDPDETDMTGCYFEVYFANFMADDYQGAPSADDWVMASRGRTMFDDPGFLDPANVSGATMEAKVLSGPIALWTGGAGKLEVTTTGVTVLAATRLHRRMRGAYIWLFSADGTTRRRFVIKSIARPDDTKIEISLATGRVAYGDLPSFTGGYFAVAPIIMRVIPALLPDGSESGEGTLKTVVAGSLAMDALEVRQAAQFSDSVAPALQWSATGDATNLQIQAIGWRLGEEALTATGSYGPALLKFYGYNWTLLVEDLAPFGRLREVVRAKIVPSRKEPDTAFKLPFGGTHVTAGIEAFCSGVLLELRGLRIVSIIKPSSRRSV